MSFWKVFFGSLLAFLAGFILLFFLSFILLAGIIAGFSKAEPVTLKANSVLQLDLDYDIREQTTYEPFSDFSFSRFEPTTRLGLRDVIRTIDKASRDENIKGIFLDFGWAGSGPATTEALRKALVQFKASGKFVVAYAEIYSERAYYLSSVADPVFVNPKGLIEFNGMNAQYMFFKGTLEKLGVEAQVFYDGKYKTATEPFRLDSMSEANDRMTRALVDDIYGHILDGIARERGMTVAALDSVSSRFLARTAYSAVQYGLADSSGYYDQVLAYLKRNLKLGDDEKVNFVSLNKYYRVPEAARDNKDEVGESSTAGDRIGLLIAQGDIVDGDGDDDNIGSSRYAELLKKLREDDKIKAVVFRINSGGGSALASDVIAREVEITAKKKPVVVSMGDYAASGGYYIAAPAQKIVAEPSTLTGSIGVFGILPNAEKLFRDKLGITFDNVQTGIYSDLGDISRPLRDDEKHIIQNQIDTIYADFKKVVMKGRNLSEAEVDSIAQGRVWTGNQALSNGLVDTIGGFREAFAIAARLAGISQYRVVEYPQPDSEWKELVEMFSKNKAELLRSELGAYYPVYKEIAVLASLKGIQARMPFHLILE